MNSENYHFVCIPKAKWYSWVVYVFDQSREYTAMPSIFPTLVKKINNSGMLLYLRYAQRWLLYEMIILTILYFQHFVEKSPQLFSNESFRPILSRKNTFAFRLFVKKEYAPKFGPVHLYSLNTISWHWFEYVCPLFYLENFLENFLRPPVDGTLWILNRRKDFVFNSRIIINIFD